MYKKSDIAIDVGGNNGNNVIVRYLYVAVTVKQLRDNTLLEEAVQTTYFVCKGIKPSSALMQSQ